MTGPVDTPAPDGTDVPHPVTGLDDVVHQRVRLGILTIAHEARRVEFGFLRTQLELTAGNLSQHLGVLEAAGLVEVEKGYAGRRARTWITLTYLVVVLVPINFGWGVHWGQRWGGAPPLVISGGVLLLGCASFALAQRLRRPR